MFLTLPRNGGTFLSERRRNAGRRSHGNSRAMTERRPYVYTGHTQQQHSVSRRRSVDCGRGLSDRRDETRRLWAADARMCMQIFALVEEECRGYDRTKVRVCYDDGCDRMRGRSTSFLS